MEPLLCCQNDQKVTKISNFVTVLERATCRTRMRTTTTSISIQKNLTGSLHHKLKRAIVFTFNACNKVATG